MKKRTYISALLMGCLLLGTGFSVTSCKDYDDDINNLQSQIDDLNKIIEQIKTQITGGSVISNVEKTTTGVKITLSNGQTYELSNGKDGTAWTIGEDGFWYKDGTKTDYKAKGDKGDTGADGAYYIPNVDGFFHKVSADGKTDEKTNISWKQNGGNIYAVMDKDNLTLFNIPDENGTVSQNGIQISLSANLRGLVFAGDRKEPKSGADGDSIIARSYIDGVPGIRVAAFDYKALSLSNPNTANEIAKEAANATRANRETYAYYHVNPANANLKDLQKLTYEIKANADYDKTRAAASSDFNVDAQVVEFNNETGILKVKLGVTGIPATDEKISVAALQAHKKNNEVVTSDYSAIYNKDMNQLRLADKDRNANKSDYHYRRAVVGISGVDREAGKQVKVWDPTETGSGADIEIQYNAETDLNKYVEAHELGATGAGYGKCSVADLDALGFKLEYSAVTGYKLGNNNTEQDKFITVTKDGKVTPKVDNITENPTASIGRTPIVRVALVDTRNKSQVVQYAYLKLKIVNNVKPENKKIDFTGLKNFKFTCDATSADVTADYLQVNKQVYQYLNLTRDQFHSTYSHFEANPKEFEKTNVGIVSQVADPTESVTTEVFKWTLTKDEMWENAGKTVKHVFQYVNPTNNSTVTITLTAQIEGVKKLYALTSANYWEGYWENGVAKFNVNVPEKGEKDPNKCVFNQDLNAPFITDKATGKILAIQEDKTITYNFFFNKKIESVTKVGDVAVKFEVKDGGEGLYATVDGTTQKVATIHNDGTKNYVELDKTSEVAKKLLNTNEFQAYISINAYACGDTNKKVSVTFQGEEYYTAKFLRPINIGAKAGKYFVDGRDLGEQYTFMKLEDLINPTDWRNRVFGKGEDKDGAYDGTTYWQYYGPFTITANVDKAEWNMNGSFEAVPSTVELKQVNETSKYGETSNYGFLTYKNNQYVLNKNVTLRIPVTVNYGWGQTSATVEVEIRGTK